MIVYYLIWLGWIAYCWIGLFVLARQQYIGVPEAVIAVFLWPLYLAWKRWRRGRK